jgi:hypothetical protein
MPKNSKKSNKNNYFGKEQEDAVALYLRTEDVEERNKIFREKLHYPFYKLSENIYNTYGPYYTDVDHPTDLYHQIVSMILEEKLEGFKPELGYKAYSYFGTVIKRWLIAYSKENHKSLLRTSSLEEDSSNTYLEEFTTTNPYDSAEESLDFVDLDNLIPLSDFIESWCEKCYNILDELFDYNEHYVLIADAVLTVLKHRTDLNLFKKKAIYLYIREITDCNTTQITKVVKLLQENFYEEYNQLYEEGHIDPSIS